MGGTVNVGFSCYCLWILPSVMSTWASLERRVRQQVKFKFDRECLQIPTEPRRRISYCMHSECHANAGTWALSDKPVALGLPWQIVQTPVL